MRLAGSFGLALRALRAHPIRGILLVQGLAWAVALPVFLGSVLEGTMSTGEKRAQEVGTGRLNVAADVFSGGRRLEPGDGESLAAHLRDEGIDVGGSGWVRVVGAGTVGRGAGQSETAVISVHGEQHTARGQRLAEGRLPTAPGEAVLEPALAASLGGARVGEELELTVAGAAQPVRVVGLMAPRTEMALATSDLGLTDRGPFAQLAKTLTRSLGVPAFDDDWKRTDACILIAADPDSPRREVDWVFVQVPPTESPRAAELASSHLTARGVTPLVHTNMLWPVLAGGTIARFARLFEALVLYCLLLGLVVVSCLLLHSVSRRTTEFAIRRAEGATASDIAAQVLCEAALLGLLGGVIGVPLGMVLAEIRVGLAPYTLLDTAFPAEIAAVCVGTSILAGCLAGLAPALRAARVPPVVAMRSGT